jgi:hypothetical protein
MMKASKNLGDIKRFLLWGGERQQIMLQYIDDTKILIRGEENTIWNIFNMLQLFV